MTVESPRPTPEEFLQTKEGILEQWRKLPADHQATMALVLLREIQDPAMIEWTKGALSISHRSEPLTIATPERLARLSLDAGQLATFTYSDLRDIESRILALFERDEFWDELLLQTLEIQIVELLKSR